MTPTRRSSGPELKRFLGAFSPEIAKIALRVRAFVLGEAPLAHELVCGADDAMSLGYSFTERPSHAFCQIALHAGWVDLGFRSGRGVRHVRIESLADLREPHVGRVVRAAMKTAARPTTATATESM